MTAQPQGSQDPSDQLVITDLDELLRQHGASPYREFLRVPALTLGVFAAGPGYTDVQEPHGEDEVYVVFAGNAIIDVDGSHSSVAAGSIIYIPRGVPHHFHDVSDDLRVVVVFVPPPA